MDFKKLYETLSIAEGDVVSFADYKNKKEQTKTPYDITIKDITLGFCESRIDKTIPLGDYTEGRRFHYQQFQEWLYKNEYFVEQEEEMFKCDFTMVVHIKKGPVVKDETWSCRFTVGGGEDLDLQHFVENRLLLNYPGLKEEEIAFSQEKVNPGNYEQAYKEWPHKKEKQEPEQLPALTGTDKKDPMDVAVGDILYTSWGYDMTGVYFYKVIERKPKSIKLARLESKKDFEDSTATPVDKEIADSNVDGKIFRIGKYAVCSITKYENCYYWDGTPKHFSDYN